MKKLTKKLTKKVRKKMQACVEKNQPELEWDYRDYRTTAKAILENGLDAYIDTLYEYNMDYMWELENEVIKYTQEEFSEYDPDEVEDCAKEVIHCDLNIPQLLRRLPDITCLLYAYSNYDCCNSFDTIEEEGYLNDVYRRVKIGVKKKDFMYEFYNGAYGGSLFCFAFQTSIENYLYLKECIEHKATITIPKGTQFGFFSSFSGSGSVFEKRTYRNMTVPSEEGQYDHFSITADPVQSYSLSDVYGTDSFIDEGNITINKERRVA
ncbi:MAG: hypothetical protein WCS33_05535 [Candidatus Caldatribacteriota bacterium]